MSEIKYIDIIKADETFEHDGSVEVGTIENGATVKIKNGGLTVKGNVGNDVRIKVDGASNSVTMNSSSIQNNFNNGSVVISGGNCSNISIIGNKVFVDGKEVYADKSQQTPSGNHTSIIINGTTGNNVTLISSYNIDIQDCGKNLAAKADYAFKGKKIDKESDIITNYSIKAEFIHENATLKADYSVKVDYLGQNSRVEADYSYKGIGIAENCYIQAGYTIKADVAHRSSRLDADYKVKVDKYIGEKPEEPKKSKSKPNRFNF